MMAAGLHFSACRGHEMRAKRRGPQTGGPPRARRCRANRPMLHGCSKDGSPKGDLERGRTIFGVLKRLTKHRSGVTARERDRFRSGTADPINNRRAIHEFKRYRVQTAGRRH